MTIRREVVSFSYQMEKELKENDYKGHWRGCSFEYLLSKLDEEVAELKEAMANSDHEHVLSEAADVANICMMIADNKSKEKQA